MSPTPADLIRARSLLEERRAKEALPILQAAIARHPQDRNLTFLLAAAHQQLGEAEAALARLASLGKVPTARFMVLLARVQTERRVYSAALAAYRWALILTPDLAEAMIGFVKASAAIGGAAVAQAPQTGWLATVRDSRDPSGARRSAMDRTAVAAEALYAAGNATDAVAVLAAHGIRDVRDLPILARGVMYAYAWNHPEFPLGFNGLVDVLNAALFAPLGGGLLDMGMRNGNITDIYLSWGSDRVDGFEPDPAAAARLQRIYADDDAVTVHAMALGDRSGTAMLMVPVSRPGAATLIPRFAKRINDSRATQWRKTPVPVRRLDDLDLPAATFWKIDVEGSESAVLDGAMQSLQHAKPRAVQVEVALDAEGAWKAVAERLLHNFKHVWFLGKWGDWHPIVFELPVARAEEAAMIAAVRKLGPPTLTASDQPLDAWLRGVDLVELLAGRQALVRDPRRADLVDRFERLAAEQRRHQAGIARPGKLGP